MGKSASLDATGHVWASPRSEPRECAPIPSGSGMIVSDPSPFLNSRTTLNRRPPPTPVGGGWPKAGRGGAESSKRIQGPQARLEQANSELDWSTAQPCTVPPPAPLGHPPPEREFWGRASIVDWSPGSHRSQLKGAPIPSGSGTLVFPPSPSSSSRTTLNRRPLQTPFGEGGQRPGGAESLHNLGFRRPFGHPPRSDNPHPAHRGLAA